MLQLQGNRLNEAVNMIYTYVNTETEKYLEMNDIIVLNVYTVRYIEAIIYMV